MESGGAFSNIQDVIANVNKTSENIQMDIDELEEIEKEISKQTTLTQNERSIQYKLKNSLKDLQTEQSQLKKILRAQIKHHQSTYHSSKEKTSSSKTTNRMKSLLKEGDKLDKTLSMADEIINMGSQSSMSMQVQNEKLRRANRNVKRIQDSAIPGLDKLMGLIKKAEFKNTLIIAAVIAMCLALMLYFHGFKQMIEITSSANSTSNTSNGSLGIYDEQSQSDNYNGNQQIIVDSQNDSQYSVNSSKSP
eukprot:403374341